MLLVKNGRVLDPATKTDEILDVLLEGERIADVAAAGKIVANGADVFDATGMIVAPGFIDIHAHLREPGQENSETIETGTRSAARGGARARVHRDRRHRYVCRGAAGSNSDAPRG